MKAWIGKDRYSHDARVRFLVFDTARSRFVLSQDSNVMKEVKS